MNSLIIGKIGMAETMENEIDELLVKIHSCRSEARVASAKALLEEKLLSEPKERLIERISQSSDMIEVEAAKLALWRKELDTSFEGLMQVIRSSSEEAKIREAAVLLGKKGYKQALEPLIELLASTTSLCVRDGVALGLRELGEQRALGPIMKMIKADPDNSSTLVYALETLDCKDILEFLVDIFISQPNNYMLRCSAFECVKKTNIASIPRETIETCRIKIQNALKTRIEEENTPQLEELAKVFEQKM